MAEDTQQVLDGPEAGGTAPPADDSTPFDGKVTEYVVQICESEDGELDWTDVAKVKVPVHTHRQTALRNGLTEAGIEITAELRARLLDAENAHVWTAKPPEPKTLRLL